MIRAHPGSVEIAKRPITYGTPLARAVWITAASPSSLLVAYAKRGAETSAMTAVTVSGVGTGTSPWPTPPAYSSLVDAKNSRWSGPSQSSTFIRASVLMRMTRAGSFSTFRTPTTAASM